MQRFNILATIARDKLFSILANIVRDKLFSTLATIVRDKLFSGALPPSIGLKLAIDDKHGL